MSIETSNTDTVVTSEDQPTTEVPVMTGKEARARRQAAKKSSATTATPPAVAAAPRTVNAVPKPGNKKAARVVAAVEASKAPKEPKMSKPGPTAEEIAEKARKKQERDDAATKRAEARATREKAAQDRENAKAQAEKNLHAILGSGDFPSIDRVIPIGELSGNPELQGANPRASLVASIKNSGILEPVTLLARTPDDTNYAIAGGRRRIAAAVEAQLGEVPAHIFVVGDNIDRLAAGLTVHLNASRSENVVADVRAIKILRAQNMTIEQVSKELDMPIGTVKKRAKLLNMPQWLEDAFFSGAIGHSVVQEVSGSDEARMAVYRGIFSRTGTITYNDIKAVKSANAGGNVADDATDGPTTTDLTKRGARRDIRSDMRLDTAILSFLQSSLAENGIGFQVNGETGEIMISRGAETLIFVAEYAANGGESPAVADVEQPTADDMPEGETTPDADDDAPTTADELDELAELTRDAIVEERDIFAELANADDDAANVIADSDEPA